MAIKSNNTKIKDSDSQKLHPLSNNESKSKKEEEGCKKPTKIKFTENGEQVVVPVESSNSLFQELTNNEVQEPGKPIAKQDDDGNVMRWYELYENYNTNGGELVELKDAEIDELRKVCRAAFEAECRTRIKDNPSDGKWLRNAMEKGTSRDRASSGALLVQTNPFCNLQALEAVIDMVKLSNKGHMDVVDVVTELMVNSLMPSYRKLIPLQLRGADWKYVRKQELGKEIREAIYAHWYFEDKLRELYFGFLTNISIILHSGQEASKCKTIVYASKLFAEIPEKEAFMLTMLVNKLGDPAKKVTIKALYHLQQVVSKHTAMAFVVTSETEKLLFRNNVSASAQHYALSFLSSISTYGDFATCQKMVNVCFAFFKILTEKGEVNSRTMQAILTCLRKAVSNIKSNVSLSDVVKPELLNVIYRMIHLANITIACQGLSLLLEVTESKGEQQSRFYNALYRKLLDPELASVGPRISNILFYILHRAMQNDPLPERAQAFIKRLLQVAFYFPPSRVCAALIVISKVMRKRKSLTIDGLTVENVVGAKIQKTIEHTDKQHEQITNNEVSKKKQSPAEIQEMRYNAFHRKSEYASANLTLKYELVRYLCYFHPTVQKFAQCILHNSAMSYYGDPLRDFSLSHFLERFAFKNPKKLTTKTNECDTVHRPTGITQKKGSYVPSGSRAMPVASLTKDLCTEDDEYIFRFLEQKRERTRRAAEIKKTRDKCKKRKPSDDEDDDSESDGEDEEAHSDVDSLDDDEFDAYLDRLGVPGGQSNDANIDEEEIDFMNELQNEMALVGKKAKTSDSRKRAASTGEDEDDMLDGWDEDDGEDNTDADDPSADEFGFEQNDENDNFSDGGSISLDDESYDVEFDDNEEEKGGSSPFRKTRKRNNSASAAELSDRNFARKLKTSDVNSLFAAADDFSELIERNVGDTTSTRSGKRLKLAKNALSGAHGTDVEVFNQDRSSVKQIAWEQSRLSGKNRMRHGEKKPYMAKNGRQRSDGKKHFQGRAGKRGFGDGKFSTKSRPKYAK